MHIIQERLYRRHCFNHKLGYIKDLGTITSDMKRMILVDDSREAITLSKENSILVSSWKGDEKDTELLEL